MSGEETATREERIGQLEAELEQLTGESQEEVEEALENAEEAVTETAEGVQEPAREGHENVTESAETIESSVEEESQEAADKLGHPEMAEQIADHLFRRLEDNGLLQHTHHSEGESGEPGIEQIPATVEPEAVRDTPPEATHWWYRPVRLRRR